MATYTPLGSFTLNSGPVSNVTPFTYGDGYTYLTILTTLRQKIDDTITVLNTNNTALNTFQTDVQTAINNQNAAINLLNTQVLQYTVTNLGAGILELHFPDGSTTNVYTTAQVDTLVGNSDTNTAALLANTGSATFTQLQTDVQNFVANNGPVQTALNTFITGLVNNSGNTVNSGLVALVQGMMGTDATVSADLHAKVLSWVQDYNDTISKALQDFVGDVRVEWFGAIGDGVTDDTASINAAIIACPVGGTVKLTQGKTYRVTNTIVNSDGSAGTKSVHVDATNATLLVDHVNHPINFYGAYTEQVSVSTITTLSNYANGGASSVEHAYQLTLNSAPPSTWKIGDLVRVVADDIIPGTRGSEDGTVAAQPRVGEYATVISLTGTTLVVAGSFEDTFSSNILVGRVSDISCSWTGGKILYSDTAFSTGSQYTIVMSTMRAPRVSHVDIPRMNRGAFFIYECYNWKVDNCVIGYGINDSTNGNYGYGIVNIASAYGHMDHCAFGQVRHGYTNGHSSINASVNTLTGHGRPCWNKISDCNVDGATSSGFDSHSSGAYETFANVTVNNAQYGITLRGRRNNVNGAVINKCGQGVYIFDEDMGGQSWGHVINDITMYNCPISFGVNNGQRAGASNYHVMDTRAIHISNVNCTWVDGQVINVIYHTVFMSNVYVKYTNDTTQATKYFGAQNSKLVLRNAYVDGSAMPGTVATPFVNMASSDTATSPNVDIEDLTLMNANGTLTYLLAGTDTNSVVYMRDCVIHYAPNVLMQAAYLGSFQWRLKDHMRNDLARVYSPGATALTSTTPVALASGSASFFAEEGDTYEYTVSASCSKSDTTVEGMRLQVYVDGAWIADVPPLNIQGSNSYSIPTSLTDWITNLASGSHTIALYAKLDSGTTGWNVNWAKLTLKRL